MDRYIQRFLNRVSLAFATVATLSLLHLFTHTPLSCSPPSTVVAAADASGGGGHPHLPSHPHPLPPPPPSLPRTSCDSASRGFLSPEKRFQKLRVSRSFRSRVSSFSSLFLLLRSLSLLRNSSHVLCVSAGAGHEVVALQESGVADVTGVDIIDFPPLVSRADPHNLPFFDSVFDLGFSAGLDGALFPSRFVSEMERTVRKGGASVLAVERCSSDAEVEEIRGLFRRSSSVGVRNVTFAGSEMTLILMRNNGKPS